MAYQMSRSRGNGVWDIVKEDIVSHTMESSEQWPVSLSTSKLEMSTSIVDFCNYKRNKIKNLLKTDTI